MIVLNTSVKMNILVESAVCLSVAMDSKSEFIYLYLVLLWTDSNLQTSRLAEFTFFLENHLITFK